MLRRETIIALRARHTAFRIAIDILYPPQSAPPPPPMPDIPPPGPSAAPWWVGLDPDVVADIRRRSEQRTRRGHLHGGFVTLVAVVFVLMCLWMAIDAVFLNPSVPLPPPPPARPILPVAE